VTQLLLFIRELSHIWVMGNQFLYDSSDEIRVMALVEPKVILCQVLGQQPWGYRVVSSHHVRF
jgi:hypothetical protein